ATVRAPTHHHSRQPRRVAPAARRLRGGVARPQLRAWPVARAAGPPPGRAHTPSAPASAGTGARLRRLGTGGPRLPPALEQPARQDHRPAASLAEPGPTLRAHRGAGRHGARLGISNLRCRLRGELVAGRTPPPPTPHADSAHSQTPRT